MPTEADAAAAVPEKRRQWGAGEETARAAEEAELAVRAQGREPVEVLKTRICDGVELSGFGTRLMLEWRRFILVDL